MGSSHRLQMFTPEELCGNLDRIERLWLEMEEAGRMGDPLCIEDPETVSERARQLDALKDLLIAPALGTS